MGERESRDLDDMKKSCKGSEAERNWVTSEHLKKSDEAETKRRWVHDQSRDQCMTSHMISA